jgi:hypothetical protein
MLVATSATAVVMARKVFMVFSDARHYASDAHSYQHRSEDFLVSLVHLSERLFVHGGAALVCPDLSRERAYDPSIHGSIIAYSQVMVILEYDLVP